MEITALEFRDIQTLVRDLCGLVLADEKAYLARMRLEPVVRAHGFTSFSDYLGRVQQLDAVLMRDELVEALTTGETSFNRDEHLFEALRRRILPALAERLRKPRDPRFPVPTARLWSAGCSTGQEPYSLAMAVMDFLGASPALALRPEQFPILATDVSSRALGIARQGRYQRSEVDRGLSAEQRKRYFHETGPEWTANPDLKRLIEFRRLNLMDCLPSMGPFELICCRNVLIYFDALTRGRLCAKFHELLAPEGLLILGAAENLYGVTDSFTSEQIGSTTVFRKSIR
jgi:chemotaxis protein methyltransferase CheR